MHPDSQPLEASFEPSDGATAGGSGRDSVVEDFNAFFEKLSSLDSLQWSSEPEPAPAAPSAAPRRRPAARPAAAKPPGKPRMTVVKSESVAAAPPAPAPAVPEPERDRITSRDVARFLKMTLVGLVLFALGLGAGWAALSLPGRFDGSMPSFAQLMERTRAIATQSGGQTSADDLRVVQAGQTAAPARATAPDEPRTPGRTPAPVPAPKAAQKAAAAATNAGAAKPAAAAAAKPAATADDGGDEAFGTPTDTAGAAGNTNGDGIELPVVGTDGAAPGAAGPQFTLQVGACSSYVCVEKYRRMLLRKVGSGAIKVVRQPRGEGQPPIQRIRVQPLGREAAEQLKSELVTLDAHFKDAYLIALH